VFWPQSDIARLVFALVIEPERLATSLSRRFVKPAPRENAPSGLHPHHRGPGTLISITSTSKPASLK
jgi:hypothetical protein